MAKRGRVRVGTGRVPLGLGNTKQVRIFLGRDPDAKQLHQELKDIQSRLNHREIRKTVEFLAHHWRCTVYIQD